MANRLHKVLEDANIKLGSVATDILGLSGRAMIHALMEGEQDAATLAEMAQGKLRTRRPELKLALEGRVTPHHRRMLRMLWKELAAVEECIADVDREIQEVTQPYTSQIEQMDPVPGIDRRTAEVVLAEVGANVDPFPSDQDLASWAGSVRATRRVPVSDARAAPPKAIAGYALPWCKRRGRPVTPSVATWVLSIAA